jgi:outer membrane protein, heavy metal efflux system
MDSLFLRWNFRYGHEQARAQREGLEQMIRRDVLLAYRRYEAARRTLDVMGRGVLAESQESFRIVKLAYDLGEMRLLDVVNQQRLFVEAQLNYAAVQQDYYAALVELERAVGKESVTP